MFETVVKLDRVQSPILRMGISINRSLCAQFTNSLKTEPLKIINSNLVHLQLMNCVLKYIKLNKYANVYGGYI